jgi:hypothetical protein
MKEVSIPIKDADEVLEKLRNKKQKAWIESLRLVNAVMNYQVSSDEAAAQLVEKVISNKFDVTKTYFICQYLIAWGYTLEPYILLSKYAKIPGQFPKLYGQYLKLGYFLQEFNNPKEWKRIRNVMRGMAETYPDEFCALFKWEHMGVRSLEKKEVAALFCEACRESNTD